VRRAVAGRLETRLAGFTRGLPRYSAAIGA